MARLVMRNRRPNSPPGAIATFTPAATKIPIGVSSSMGGNA